MVTAGTSLTLDVKGHTGQWLPRTSGELRANILNNLSPNFQVHDVVITSGGDNPLDTGFGLWNWDFTAVVTLTTNEAYNDSDNVASIVASVVNDASGTMPAVSVRGFGQQVTPDVNVGPSWLSVTSLLALGALAIFAMVYWPRR